MLRSENNCNKNWTHWHSNTRFLENLQLQKTNLGNKRPVVRPHVYTSYRVFISFICQLSMHHCKTKVSTSEKFAKTHAAISSNYFRFKEFW